MATQIRLSGEGLTPDQVVAIADGARVDIDDADLDRMRKTHGILQEALTAQRPIYGVTTGLGPRVVERLSPDEQTAMSVRTIRGRAHSVGAPLPIETVRAAMAVRANTLLIGASGAAPDLAMMLADCLNAGLTPVVRESGSIGAGDLMWGGNMGLGLIGEGQMDTPDGCFPAAQALAAAGLQPYRPGPREGLALVASSCFVGGLAAQGLIRSERAFESTQTAAALALESFRANLSPFRFRALALRPQPGQMAAAAGIYARLDGSDLHRPGAARRVQDPLSLRNIAQVHGTVVAALDTVDEAVREEINGASDNPVVLARTGEVLSAGGYLSPHLTVTLGMLAQAFVHLAAAQVARISKLMNPRLSDLPVGLVAAGTDSAGIAPATKSAEAMFSEIVHLAQPSPVYPSGAADGVEDIVTHSPVPAKALLAIAERLDRLCAMELMVATQAIELRAPAQISPAMRAAMKQVRAVVPPVTEDRALSDDIEALAARVTAGAFMDPENTARTLTDI